MHGARDKLTTMRRLYSAIALIFALTTSVVAQDSDLPRAKKEASDLDGSSAIVIKVGRVYVDSDKTLTDATIVVRGGEIVSIGDAISVPEDAKVVELGDAVITAGLIDASLSVAAFESYTGPENETECTPDLRVLDSIDLNDPLLQRLADSGVTTVYVTAEPTAVIGPQGVLLRTGGPVSERVIKPALGFKTTIGREPIYRSGRNQQPWDRVSHMTRRPTTRMGLVWMIRKALHDATAANRNESPGSSGEGAPTDRALPYLQRALKGEIPIRIQARKQLDILSALRISNEFGFKFIIEEGTDAARCAEALKEAGASVIYGPILAYPTGFRAGTGEVDRARYSAPMELLKAGIPMALTASDMADEGGLARQATYAIRCGLSREQALAAVTTTPAKLLGLEQGAGTLAKGRSADLVVWSGEPFEATSRPLLVLVGGRVVSDQRGEE